MFCWFEQFLAVFFYFIFLMIDTLLNWMGSERLFFIIIAIFVIISFLIKFAAQNISLKTNHYQINFKILPT